MMAAPTYHQRLRLEGAVLAGCGAVATIAVLAGTAQATRGALSTGVQLLVVAVLLLGLGPRGLRRSLSRSHELGPGRSIGSGEPTPLWHIVAIVAVLTAAVGGLAGWDVGLRVTGGCVLVGLAQALVLGPLVTREQRATNRTFYRVAGSRIVRGTRLGYVTESSPRT